MKRKATALVAAILATAPVARGDGAGGFPAFANDVEGALVRTILALRESGLRHALGEIESILARNPNFRLGHLIQGDLLMARSGKPVAFAGVAPASPAVAPLKEEARVRLKRYLEAPPVDYLPAPLLRIAPSQKNVLLVDTSRSRLYIYANDGGRPRHVADFYISLGKNGIEKRREGDQKTPIGIYTVVSAKTRLPDFYGSGAFPISYPNEWDKHNGRDGHGIWLHGTPSDTYSRPPFATDGCVVLSNEDLLRLGRYVDVKRTPVVIGSGIQWRDARAWQGRRDEFMAAFGRWRADWESRDTARYLSHYAPGFRSDGQDLAAWSAHKRKVNAGKTWVKVGVEDLGFFAYPDASDMMMVTFRQDYRSNNLSNRTLKRQYWKREGGAWRIVHESVVS